MTTGLVGDIESVKAAIAAVVASVAFADQLAVVNAEKHDGYTTPGPAAIYDHEHANIEVYPALELQGLNTTYDAESEVKIATHKVALVWTALGDNEQTITKDVERLVRTTRDVFWRSLLGGAIGTQPILIESEDYSQLSPAGRGGAFVKGGQVILIVTTYTN